MLSFFKKKEKNLSVDNNDITAVADGKIIPLEDVKDEVFAQKVMGDGVAFEFTGDIVYSPCNGKLEVVFPTGHAYGFRMKDGTSLLLHIGINTVESQGDGFKSLVKQDQTVKAGDPLVKLDRKKLDNNYDMTTMLIVTEPAENVPKFAKYGFVTMGEKINE